MPPRNSDITVTDQFCGAGGSSSGAKRAGLRVRMAMNHWKLAIETHNTNFPETDHDCCDISASDPRRYPSTDVLITSPECTTHSPAGGNRRRPVAQRDLFLPTSENAGDERSRATMWDVPRFAEYHRYRRIICENVVEVMRWELFDIWLKAMHTLGYEHKIVSLNSMFCWPTPQSRDRVYINFWRNGDPAPDLDIRPMAPCARCGLVEAVQTWKNGRTVGKYRFQYTYTCPTCRVVVTPFYYAALNAIDFSIAATRVGDRKRVLKQRTLERIRYGLAKYGHRELMIIDNAYAALARSATTQPFATQTSAQSMALLAPFVVQCANTGRNDAERRTHMLDAALSTVHASGGNHALCSPSPFLVRMRGGDPSHVEQSGIGLDDAMPSFTANGTTAALVSSMTPFLLATRTGSQAGALDESLRTICTDQQMALVQGAAQLSMRDASAMRVAGLDAELMTQGCAPQQGLIQQAPFIVSQYRSHNTSPIDAPVPTMTTLDRHSLVQPTESINVDDCYFRMLQPHEVGLGMGFDASYVVLGNKRERIKQFGNAVTPPAMELQLRRQVDALIGIRVA